MTITPQITARGKTIHVLTLRDLTDAVESGERLRAYCPIHGGDHQRSLSIDLASGWGFCHCCHATVLVEDLSPTHVFRPANGYERGHARRCASREGSSADQPLPSSLRPHVARPVRAAMTIQGWQREEVAALQAILPVMREVLASSWRAQRYLDERGIALPIACANGVGYLSRAIWEQLSLPGAQPFLKRWVGRILFPLASPDGQGYIGRTLLGWEPGMDENTHKALLDRPGAPRRWIKTNPAGWFGGDILGFYYYWFRYNPQFWRRLGLGWNDAEKALSRYGVIQEWTKEYESDARKGSGQTNVQVSTIPAPGLSAKLIPYLLEDMVYLTVLDVGAHMPPRIEIPEIVPMRDAEIADALFEAELARKEAARLLQEFTKTHAGDIGDLNEAKEREQLEQAVRAAAERERGMQEWALPRHLASHYGRLVRSLDDLARRRNTAARLAKGTVPRWFAVLPCDQPFQVWETKRDRWGDIQGREMLVETERLTWDYLYPLERRLIALVQQELREGRRVMLYVEQNDLRSMSRRLEWALKEALKAMRLQPWTLPNSVAAEDRQQAILQAVQRGHRVVIVPYRRVNEGLNLQSGIDTIIWVEMALNLFMLDQASRRAWRLGKHEEVRIYYLAYAHTAGHTKLRKLGQQSGAAAAFAGEPARGALIAHAGADKTTLARLSSLLEQSEDEDAIEEDAQVMLSGEGAVAEEEATLKAVFARRAEELRQALVRGREWLGGIRDDLAERLAAIAACPTARGSVWAERPVPLVPLLTSTRTGSRVDVEQPPRNDRKPEPTLPLPTVTAPVLPADGVEPSPALPAGAMTIFPPIVPLPEPAPFRVVGSRSAVVFGRDAHIALVRVRSRTRRSHSSGEPLRRRIPVSEREIPSLREGETVTASEEQRHPVAMPSLWDLLVAPTSGATQASPALVAASYRGEPIPQQSHLWE